MYEKLSHFCSIGELLMPETGKKAAKFNYRIFLERFV